MKSDEISRLFTANTAAIFAIIKILVRKKIASSDEIIQEIDSLISMSSDPSGIDTASLRHLRYLLLNTEI